MADAVPAGSEYRPVPTHAPISGYELSGRLHPAAPAAVSGLLARLVAHADRRGPPVTPQGRSKSGPITKRRV